MKNISGKAWLSVLVAAAIAGFATPSSAEQEFTLRIGAGHNPIQAYVAAFDTYFIPEVTRRAAEKGYKLKFVKAWAGTVAKADAVSEATEKQVLDIGLTVQAFEPSRLAPLIFGSNVPFSSTDPHLAAKAAMDVIKNVPALKEYMRGLNVELLGIGAAEPFNIILKHPVTKPEDLKGLRIGAATTNGPWVAAMGAIPVSVTVPEVYQSMQTGLIDGYVLFYSGFTSLKLMEVAKYFYKTDFGSVTTWSVVMNLDTRKKLPPDLVALIDSTAEETVYKASDIMVTNDTTAKAAVEGKIQVIQLSDEDRIRWATALKDLPGNAARELNTKKMPGTEIYRAYIEGQKKLGHKFPVDYPL